MVAGPACLSFVASGNADGRGCVLDEIPRIGHHDPFTGLVAYPGDSVLAEAHLDAPQTARTPVLFSGLSRQNLQRALAGKCQKTRPRDATRRAARARG